MLTAFLLVQVACLDPDSSTSSGKRDLAAGMPCLKEKPNPRDIPGNLVAVTPAEQSAIKAYFDATLLDGPSARWRFPRRVKSERSYCGFVNAKNRMGAYTGWAPFIVTLERGKVTYGDAERVDGGAVRIMCEVIGYDGTLAP